MFEVLAMTAYEKLLKQMQNQAKKTLPCIPEIAEMLSENSVRVRNLVLKKEDLLCASHLTGKLTKGDTVLIQRISDEKYVIIERVISFA